MATRLDQQIEQLEEMVERRVDFYEGICEVRSCVLPRSHARTEPHLSLIEFLEMQARQGAEIFATHTREILRENAGPRQT